MGRSSGKVMSGSLLVFAAVFAGVGLFVPEARGVCLVAAAGCAAAALLGVPLVVRAFMSITGDEDVLEHGLPETAIIMTIAPTGWRYNRYYPIVRFGVRRVGIRLRASGGTSGRDSPLSAEENHHEYRSLGFGS